MPKLQPHGRGLSKAFPNGLCYIHHCFDHLNQANFGDYLYYELLHQHFRLLFIHDFHHSHNYFHLSHSKQSLQGQSQLLTMDLLIYLAHSVLSVKVRIISTVSFSQHPQRNT
jgi:hypothetical protein